MLLTKKIVKDMEMLFTQLKQKITKKNIGQMLSLIAQSIEKDYRYDRVNIQNFIRIR